SRLGPIAASVLAGFLGAGVVDVMVTVARAQGPAAPPSLLLLALGLYGTAGLLAACVVGLLAGGVLGAIPGGPSALVENAETDRAAASAILGGLGGLVVAAVIAALGQRMLVRPMQSDKLATIAAAGLVFIAGIPATALAVGLYRPMRRLVAPRLPRPATTGATGALLLALVAVGVLAAIAAFSRADWRVLDLAPFAALGLAVVAGVAHGIFWYRTYLGRRAAVRIPASAVSHVLVIAILVALVAASRLPESSPAFAAADQGSLGLRLALRIARATTDRDGDGFSARFGGGDCDDHRADVYPGAEDVPGNGVDENCEGGDAVAVAEDDGDDDPEEMAAAEGQAPPPSGPAAGKAADGGKASPGAGAAEKFTGNILIITIDALRGDRLGVAGYSRPDEKGRSLTPNLDALARRGAYFRRVWSQAPNTPRSFPSILTSQTPSGVKWDKPRVNYPNLLESNHTFFEDLRAAGLTPIGIFSHFYFTADRGISKAFKEWSNEGAGTIAESNKDIASPRIVPKVIARLKKAAASKERFVLWTHLFEPHSSYMTHKEFPSSGASGPAGLMEKYDHEIAYVDSWVGKVLAALESTGLAKKTAVVIMADHGEAWGEHKFFFHGQDLFDEQLRIPLIIAVPGREPVTSEEPVAAYDVGPATKRRSVRAAGGRPAGA
ncbi:MAG TPA: sulfatase-like hydrolase/transferase, partial [Polyangia bacterium]